MTEPISPSNLFYDTQPRRPRIARAEGIYIWDKAGKRYIDGSSGPMSSNLGHGNPYVLDAMRQQMDVATFAYRLHFENDATENLATRLAKRFPDGMDKVFFVSGGSEAVESCLKLARQWAIATKQASRYKVISRYPSYHGSTLGALGVTGMAVMTAPFSPMLREMPKIAAPTCYLDRNNLNHEQRGLAYANLLEEQILREGAETVLAFIMEPIGGASTGALVAPDSYYPRIRKICDHYGVLLILDEVMTGAGRTGRFCGAEHWDLKPDITALSKGLGGGYAPLGAMVADTCVVEPVIANGGFIHGHTYAGNPLACAAGLAVLEELENRQLIGNAEIIGEILKTRLKRLMECFEFIGDVRGLGLLLAFELVADRKTMTPLPVSLNAHQRLVEIAYGLGLIIYSRRTRGGGVGDHFMVCPPLITTQEQVDEIIDLLDQSLVIFAKEAKLGG
jgi:adenosylmethionine-8-amino-7-oxononanoate aminotransferase